MEKYRTMHRNQNSGYRHSMGSSYVTQEMAGVLNEITKGTKDPTLAQSIYFSPTALTHIRRLIETGGTIVTDTTLLANGLDSKLIRNKGAQIRCFIDDPQVLALSEQRMVTRAEVAVDYGLALEGPKLMVFGSAPAGINRMIVRRQYGPLSDVCVFAAPNGFVSTVQLKEKLVESNLTSIVVRGKKGGIPTAVAVLNAILREVAGKQYIK